MKILFLVSILFVVGGVNAETKKEINGVKISCIDHMRLRTLYADHSKAVILESLDVKADSKTKTLSIDTKSFGITTIVDTYLSKSGFLKLVVKGYEISDKLIEEREDFCRNVGNKRVVLCTLGPKVVSQAKLTAQASIIDSVKSGYSVIEVSSLDGTRVKSEKSTSDTDTSKVISDHEEIKIAKGLNAGEDEINFYRSFHCSLDWY